MSSTARPSMISDLRADLTERFAARQAHRVLAREIAAYDSSADRLDLEAMLDQYTDEDTAEIRTLLARTRVAA